MFDFFIKWEQIDLYFDHVPIEVDRMNNQFLSGRLAALGLNSYRFSIEWARIEPEEGQFDEAAM
ncbi:glycoside hydrolase family protein [Paenibacillus sp. FSL R7-277]|nr:glycoside hydrolase family protein [Paenibacillus sp. FSL R7-277]